MCRARRQSSGKTTSNIRWNYGHNTVPRHHRDVFVTEYGIAATRGCSDRDTIDRLLHIAAAEFHAELIEAARLNRKIESTYTLDKDAIDNRPDVMEKVFDGYREYFPPYPLGTEFTADEQSLVDALGWLRSRTATTAGAAKTLLLAMTTGSNAGNESALARMQLANPSGIREGVLQKLLKLALHRTQP